MPKRVPGSAEVNFFFAPNPPIPVDRFSRSKPLDWPDIVLAKRKKTGRWLHFPTAGHASRARRAAGWLGENSKQYNRLAGGKMEMCQSNRHVLPVGRKLGLGFPPRGNDDIFVLIPPYRPVVPGGARWWFMEQSVSIKIISSSITEPPLHDRSDPFPFAVWTRCLSSFFWWGKEANRMAGFSSESPVGCGCRGQACSTKGKRRSGRYG